MTSVRKVAFGFSPVTQTVCSCFQTVSPLETHRPPFFFFARELLHGYSHDANMCTCRCRSSITQATVAKRFGLGHPDLCSPLSCFTRLERLFNAISHSKNSVLESQLLLKIPIRIIKSSFRHRPGWQRNDEQVGHPKERPRPAVLIEPLRCAWFGDPAWGFEML